MENMRGMNEFAAEAGIEALKTTMDKIAEAPLESVRSEDLRDALTLLAGIAVVQHDLIIEQGEKIADLKKRISRRHVMHGE